MIIPISKTIRIRGTADCWQLEKAVTRKGAQEWQGFKYYRSVAEAVGEACRREIRLHPARGLADAITAVEQIAARYNNLLDHALAEGEPGRAA